MNDFFEKLRGMDKKQLEEAVKQAKAFVKTDEGKAFVEKVKQGGSEQDNIKKELGKNPEIAKLIFDILKG